MAIISGWGLTSVNAMEMSAFLREGEVQVLQPLQCPAATNVHGAYNFKSMICAYGAGHTDTCQVSLLITSN